MKRYRPTLHIGPKGDVARPFTANVVHAETSLVAFGEIIADPERGLPHGTPVHSLLLHFADGGLEMVEFNDEANAVSVTELERIALARDHARFEFRRDEGPMAGRVSLEEEIEVFDDEDWDDAQLCAIEVHFALDDARFEASCVASTLSHCLADAW